MGFADLTQDKKNEIEQEYGCLRLNRVSEGLFSCVYEGLFYDGVLPKQKEDDLSSILNSMYKAYKITDFSGSVCALSILYQWHFVSSDVTYAFSAPCSSERWSDIYSEYVSQVQDFVKATVKEVPQR